MAGLCRFERVGAPLLSIYGTADPTTDEALAGEREVIALTVRWLQQHVPASDVCITSFTLKVSNGRIKRS